MLKGAGEKQQDPPPPRSPPPPLPYPPYCSIISIGGKTNEYMASGGRGSGEKRKG